MRLSTQIVITLRFRIGPMNARDYGALSWTVITMRL